MISYNVVKEKKLAQIFLSRCLRQIKAICCAGLFCMLLFPGYSDNITISPADCNSSTLATDNGTATLTAQYRPNNIGISWYNDGEKITGDATAATTCEYGTNFNLPVVPTKTGYVFDGWQAVTVPSGYTALEYIQSSGAQWIDTGIKGNLNTKAQIKFVPTQVASSTWYAVFGARTSASSNAFNLWSPRSDGKMGVNFSSLGVVATPVTPAVNTEYVVELSKDGLIINDSRINFSSTPASFTTPTNILVFNINGGSASTSGTGNRVFVGKVYYFRLYSSGEIVLNLLPAKRNSDNKIGMYDTVSGTFFENAGTGVFTANQ